MPGPRCFDDDVDGSIDRDDTGPPPDRELPTNPTTSLGLLDPRNRVLNDSAAPTRRARRMTTVRKRDGITVVNACLSSAVVFPCRSDNG